MVAADTDLFRCRLTVYRATTNSLALIKTAQDLKALAEKGAEMLNFLLNDPLTRQALCDYFDALLESIPYVERYRIGSRLVVEIGLEVLIALATAGLGNILTNAGRATRIGHFSLKAIEELAALYHKIKKAALRRLPEAKPEAAQGKKKGGGSQEKEDQRKDQKDDDRNDEENRREEKKKKESTSERIARLEGEGHAPQRHGGPNRVTDQQLEDRAVRGIDPASGTTLDAYNKFPDGTPKQHKVGRHATAFTSDDALVAADDFARSSTQFQQNVVTAKANGDLFVDPVELKLEDVFGKNYKDQVRGTTRLGSKNNPTGHIPTDFTDGTIKAIYRLDENGNVNLHTLYPNPKI